ncbi:hypothetical protein [Ohtaekwangia koreensis]|uniref:hypothetical protein n=1 Tax=Ohtaekwangia koreensis TaxID=688867 RepID=UPI0009A7E334|nr:hypothetical protein [Ohtaekwangia koreensis]
MKLLSFIRKRSIAGVITVVSLLLIINAGLIYYKQDHHRTQHRYYTKIRSDRHSGWSAGIRAVA